jgi:hypothetical protein
MTETLYDKLQFVASLLSQISVCESLHLITDESLPHNHKLKFVVRNADRTFKNRIARFCLRYKTTSLHKPLECRHRS